MAAFRDALITFALVVVISELLIPELGWNVPHWVVLVLGGALAGLTLGVMDDLRHEERPYDQLPEFSQESKES